jgi:hypothetical protein
LEDDALTMRAVSDVTLVVVQRVNAGQNGPNRDASVPTISRLWITRHCQ